MPAPLTYPGVYVEEIPSGVRPITGVATSVTAFVGRALRGPVDSAITITAYADFERIFGGLWLESSLGYAVNDFYRNGGSTAIVVRVHKTKTNDIAGITLGSAARQVALVAASPGAWGSKLSATIDNLVSDSTDATPVQPDGDGRRLGQDGVVPQRLLRRRERAARRSRTGRRVDARPPHGLAADLTAVVVSGLRDGDQRQRRRSGRCGPLRRPEGEPSSRQEGAVRARERRPGEPARDPAVHLDRRDRLDRAGGHDRVRGGAPRRDGDGTAGRMVEPRQRRHRRLAAAFTSSKNAALYFPRLRQPDPLRDDQLEDVRCRAGAVAGVFARTDATRGVWKAPAGTRGRRSRRRRRSRSRSPTARTAQLNPLGVNCLRAFPASAASSGARGRCRAPTRSPTSGSTSRSAGPRCSSRRACTAARSGSCSSRTTSRSGRRSG